MSGIDHLVRLVTELGPAMQLAGVYQVTEGKEWELVLAEGFTLSLQYEDSDNRLTVTGDVIDLSQTPPAELLVTMLQYNAASTETGGVRLALDSKMTVLLIYDMPVSGLSLDTLKTTILSLADKIVAWRQAIAGRLDGDEKVALPTAYASGDMFIINA